jgi:hypothetical protein
VGGMEYQYHDCCSKYHCMVVQRGGKSYLLETNFVGYLKKVINRWD